VRFYSGLFGWDAENTREVDADGTLFIWG